MNRIYITTSIPYVNAVPHIGFGLEYVQVDAAGRYWRERYGEGNVRTQTGSDENSLKNVRAAEEAGEDVASFVKRHAAEFEKLDAVLDAQYDDFIRTREDRHIRGAQALWSRCKPEDIYKKPYTGLYCVGCELFYPEKDVENRHCPIHKKELEEVSEENYFFRLSNYEDKLLELIESKQLRIMPENRKNEVISFIKSGLEDFSISRSQERAKHWGVPVPGDESQVMYVWFDALSNYITALGFADDEEAYHRFWLENERRAHVIGKDIVRFHAVYWPAMLMSAGVPLPTELFVHGFFTIEGEKMSKSIGNVIQPKELVDEYGVDAVRYFLLREMPYADDGDISRDRLEIRYAELANQLGNLVNRVAAMTGKYFDGKLDLPKVDWLKQDADLEDFMSHYNFKAYLDYVFEAVGRANELIDKEQPFKTVKTDPEAAKKTLTDVAEIIRWVGTALKPIMPGSAEEILRRYSNDGILTGDPLFPRRDV